MDWLISSRYVSKLDEKQEGLQRKSKTSQKRRKISLTIYSLSVFNSIRSRAFTFQGVVYYNSRKNAMPLTPSCEPWRIPELYLHVSSPNKEKEDLETCML